MSVDNGWNTVVVDVRLTALGDRLDAHDALVLGLVRKHRALDDVADGVNVWHIRLESVVGGDAASLVDLDTNVLQAQLGSVRPSANANEKSIAVELKNRVQVTNLNLLEPE